MVGFSRSNFLCILNTFTALLNTSGLYNAKFVNLRVNISWLDLWHRLADLSGYEFWDSGFWVCELLCLFGDDLCFLVDFTEARATSVGATDSRIAMKAAG